MLLLLEFSFRLEGVLHNGRTVMSICLEVGADVVPSDHAQTV